MLTEERKSNIANKRKRSDLSDWLSRVEGRFMGVPIDIHPHAAIMHALRITAGEVAYCDAQIARLHEDEIFERPRKQTEVTLPSGEIDTVTEVRDYEQISRWVEWRAQAIKNMATYAKMALDANIDERQIQLVERQAHQLVEVITAVLTDLGHDVRDIRTRDIVRRRLLEGSIIDGKEAIA